MEDSDLGVEQTLSARLDSLVALTDDPDDAREFLSRHDLILEFAFANAFENVSEVSEGLRSAWERCAAWASFRVAEVVAASASSSSSSSSSTSTSWSSPACPPHVAAWAAKDRLLASQPSNKRARHAAVAAESQRPGAHLDENELLRVREHMSFWQTFLEVGELGDQWSQFAPLAGGAKAQLKALRFEQWCELPVSSLQGYCSTLRRWYRFADSHRAPHWPASSLLLSLFLRECRNGGPTAPHGVAARLRWLRAQLAAPWELDTHLVRSLSRLPPAHAEERAMPLTPKCLLSWELLARHPNVYMTSLGYAWCRLFWGCLRYAHFQRSSFISFEDSSMEFEASRGKRRDGEATGSLLLRFAVFNLDLDAARRRLPEASGEFLLLVFLLQRVVRGCTRTTLRSRCRCLPFFVFREPWCVRCHRG